MIADVEWLATLTPIWNYREVRNKTYHAVKHLDIREIAPTPIDWDGSAVYGAIDAAVRVVQCP